MTLVVARKTENRVQMVGDTQLSLEGQVHVGPIRQGILKCVALSPSCCIGFAGNSERAKDALRWCLGNPNATTEQIRNHLTEAHLSSQRDTDFILATRSDGGTLDRVSGGEVQVGLDTAHIGDPAAFERYQQLYHTPRRASGSESDSAQRNLDAMADLIKEGSIGSVSGYAVSVSALRSGGVGFKYWPHMAGSGFRPVAGTTEPTSVLRSLGAEGGSYHYSVLVPEEPGVGAIAIHVLEGNFGMLLYPKVSWDPVLFHEVSSSQELMDRIAEKYKIRVGGFLLSSTEGYSA